MCYPETKKGQMVADKIRRTLFNSELERANLIALLDVAKADVALYDKLGDKEQHEEAMIRVKAYESSVVDITNAIQVIKNEVNCILARYTPKYQKIWLMYFIQGMTIGNICTEVHYSRANVNVIIKKLKDDMNYYEGEN